MLNFLDVIICILLHWRKKLTLASCRQSGWILYEVALLFKKTFSHDICSISQYHSTFFFNFWANVQAEPDQKQNKNIFWSQFLSLEFGIAEPFDFSLNSGFIKFDYRIFLKIYHIILLFFPIEPMRMSILELECWIGNFF